jgi:MarR family transcriptional regulator, organic hydroperoxide resistance regulator
MPPDPCKCPNAPSEPALAAWFSVVRVYHKVVRRLERKLDQHGLALAHFEMLVKLSMAEGMTQQELAARLLVTKGNVCVLLDRMESNGWVERREHPEDRRANRLFLTRQGKKLLDEAMPEHLKLIRETMSAMSGSQQKSVHEALDRVDQSVELE